MKEIVFTACSSFVAIELIYFISPDEKILKCVYALVYALIIVSTILTFSAYVQNDFSLDFSQSDFSTGEDNLYLNEAQLKLNSDIKGALTAAGVETADIEVLLNMDDEKNVTVEKLSVKTLYSADVGRAKIIVDKLFSGMADIEVSTVEQ